MPSDLDANDFKNRLARFLRVKDNREKNRSEYCNSMASFADGFLKLLIANKKIKLL